MKFSIIMVSLNPGERIRKTLVSVLNQTCKDYEVIIKDGGSTDASLETVADLTEDERVKVHICQDKSIYDAMNQAVKLASGDYFIFLNCGDEFENDRVLEKMIQYMGNNREIYYGDMKRRGVDEIIPSPHKITDFVCYRNIPCHQVCFYNRKLFEERAYDVSYPVRADYEHFLWSIYIKKAYAQYLPVTVCLYEGQGFSETEKNLKLAELEHKAITRKYIGNKCLLYSFIMIITLQPLRKKMADSKLFSGLYQKIKGLVYGRK